MRFSVLLLGASLWSGLSSADQPMHRCGTAQYFHQALAQPRFVEPRQATAGRTLVSPFGDQPNLTLSEHFAFRAGGDAPDPAEVQKLLATLEKVYQQEIDVMGHPAPVGADQFYINVFLGNSGSGTPAIDQFAYAYVTLDNTGLAYVVVQPDLLAEYGTNNFGFAEATLAHEFYHAIQFGTGAFGTDDGYWFWEASADWISVEVFPEIIDGDAFVPGYLMYPHVALESYDYPDSGTLIETHHYGAQIFARYLSEQVADPSIIRDAWVQGSATETPITALTRLLAERGEDFTHVFADFAAHNAVLDYERANSYQSWIDSYLPLYPGEDHRVAFSVGPGGIGPTDAPAETLPNKLAYNAIQIFALDGTQLNVSFAGDTLGSAQSKADFHVTVVRKSPTGIQYLPVELTDQQGQLSLDDLRADEQIFLVVASEPATAVAKETFSYRFSVLPPISFGGGACAVGAEQGAAPTSMILLLSLLGLLLWQRRLVRVLALPKITR